MHIVFGYFIFPKSLVILDNMKSKLIYFASFTLLIAMAVSGCQSDGDADKKDTAVTAVGTVNQIVQKQNTIEDSILLANLVKTLYKWHVTQKLTFEGFKPVKLNTTDTLYKGIDLFENQKSVDELRGTGLFADSFLKDYRNIALRMDKELRDGSSIWPANGDPPTFDNDVDPWCDCQDEPIDDYWKIIKLNNLSINNNEAHFNWIWEGYPAFKDFKYKMVAVRQNNDWKIAYMQGYDLQKYNWGAGKKMQSK